MATKFSPLLFLCLIEIADCLYLKNQYFLVVTDIEI
jgi:hypothetical protein